MPADRHAPTKAWISALLEASSTDECVTWPFCRKRNGYGQVGDSGRSLVASRYICEAAHGAPPTPAHEASHSCGNGHLGCVNPAHLSWATKAENAADRIQHGTSNRGDRHGMGKLAEVQVREMLARLSAGESRAKLAAEFGVAQQTVGHIATGRRWAWLPRPSTIHPQQGQTD